MNQLISRRRLLLAGSCAARGREILMRLVAECDVLVENMSDANEAPASRTPVLR